MPDIRLKPMRCTIEACLGLLKSAQDDQRIVTPDELGTLFTNNINNRKSSSLSSSNALVVIEGALFYHPRL